MRADDFGFMLALINSKPHFEHFPLMMALPLTSLRYAEPVIGTFSLQKVQ
jgi:hypothetical protein